MRKFIIILFVVFASCKATQVTQHTTEKELGPNPYFEIDGRQISKEEFQDYDAEEVSILTIYYNEGATNLFGDKAKDGAVIITSKKLSIKKYQELFSSKSRDYKKAIKEYGDSEIQYILNDRILVKDFEGDLATIDNKILKRISLLSQEDLMEKYNIEDKKIGVNIKAKLPK